jgi:hypothetical protein
MRLSLALKLEVAKVRAQLQVLTQQLRNSFVTPGFGPFKGRPAVLARGLGVGPTTQEPPRDPELPTTRGVAQGRVIPSTTP